MLNTDALLFPFEDQEDNMLVHIHICVIVSSHSWWPNHHIMKRMTEVSFGAHSYQSVLSWWTVSWWAVDLGVEADLQSPLQS